MDNKNEKTLFWQITSFILFAMFLVFVGANYIFNNCHNSIYCLEYRNNILYLITFCGFMSIVLFVKYKLKTLSFMKKELEQQLEKQKREFENQFNIKKDSLLNEIKDREEAEEKLENSLNEKVILLKEIHHRVKNNLAIITGLIRMQCRQIKDENIKDIFKSLQNRIKTMELIHTNLYSSTDFTQVNFNSYIHSLVQNLKKSFDTENNVTFQVSCTDISLTIEQAIACGQIVNELITNSFKHAYTDNKKGTITIELIQKENLFTLIVADDGKGVKHLSQKTQQPSSLGMTLVYELVKYQLKGKLEIINLNGIKYQIDFKKTQ
ncbi:sensor histidine kinase [Sulfurospirillum arcachonense]|uniref:sensor histidine kinase n=1 Tax=Sulfurospirillum arcachonense TaxID=57666 RepID=UPI00046A4A7D|nr:histidine kinase dimerization/phosphoacceptor domain -containing protein [Sulfurospirillum arcachonense]